MTTNPEQKAAQIVTSALLGHDHKAVIVAEKVYVIPAPTIHRLVSAAHHLTAHMDNASANPITTLTHLDDATRALSVFIQGDESLADELAEGTHEEIVHGLDVALSFMSIENFARLSALKRSVARLIAKPRS